ncbi:MAG: hypothetical protein ACX932_05745, partial [Gammaproteobacteria bacterium]
GLDVHCAFFPRRTLNLPSKLPVLGQSKPGVSFYRKSAHGLNVHSAFFSRITINLSSKLSVLGHSKQGVTFYDFF